jgi:hypothetical protein
MRLSQNDDGYITEKLSGDLMKSAIFVFMLSAAKRHLIIFCAIGVVGVVGVVIGCSTNKETSTPTLDTSSNSQEIVSEESFEENTPDPPITMSLKISPLVPEVEIFYPVFTQYVNVWGVHIIATPSTAEEKILHAANVMAQYLDNDEDGLPDDSRVIKALVRHKSILIMTATEAELEGIVDHFEQLENIDKILTFNMQDLYGSETAPEQGFDASLEEVHHLLLNYGWAEVFPSQLGQEKGSAIAKAMDIARGGEFDSVPSEYPEEAWYTYNDRTCDYVCMITEYTYWAHTSLLGGQVGRQFEIGQEWRLETPEKVRTGDVLVIEILENSELLLPTVLPDGRYQN